MTLTILSREDALCRIGQALRLPAPNAIDGISVSLIAQAFRRAAHILAPCPRHEVERAVLQSLTGLAADSEGPVSSTAEVLDSLIAYGDILEMRAPADDPWTISPLIVRPAPPAFVIRKNGSAIILGVAGDDISPLSGYLNERLACHGVLRTLTPDGAEDLRSFLAELGLIELSEKIWLHLPPMESTDRYRAAWAQRLSETAPVSAIEGLLVLDTRKPPSFYTGRWVEPNSVPDGMHIGRRAQRYGAPLWGLVDLFDGAPRRFLDLASRIVRERPCDIAWRLQMAIDAEAGAPQQVRLRPSDHGQILDFFSPLPSWAERRLAVLGERTEPHRSLLSFLVPAVEVDESIEFLKDYLWIASNREAGQGEPQ